MTEIVLLLALIGLGVLHGWTLYRNSEERKVWMRAFLSKDVTEFVAAEVMEKQKPTKSEQSDLMSLDSLDDVGFQTMISTQLEKANDGK